MQPFEYKSAASLEEAIKEAGAGAASEKSRQLIAGGTTKLDLMKLSVEKPDLLIDINHIGLNKIEKKGDSLFIGALITNSELAFNELVKNEYPVLSQAILSGASAQLRNMATAGGNVMQRTRCYYFRDSAFPCNKREPGSGCPAIEGYNRIHAILGGSDSCVATHGSDMCVALVALDAILHLKSASGKRSVEIKDFHLLPGKTPEKENLLAPGEIITSIELPKRAFAKNSLYLKVRDRASYAYSLSSAAVALEIKNQRIESCRVALGGVATKPWRAEEAEAVLTGNKCSENLYKKAAEAALSKAKALKHNGFKIELTKRTIVRALILAGEIS